MVEAELAPPAAKWTTGRRLKREGQKMSSRFPAQAPEMNVNRASSE